MTAFDFDTQRVRTDDFDGPLELLLYLVRRQGVGIKEIKLSDITDSYLQALEHIQLMDLDTAGDFLLIAATLCYIKSQDILGLRQLNSEIVADEPSPEDVQNRLRNQIIQYERYREAAKNLSLTPLLNQDVFIRPEPEVDEVHKVQTNIDAYGLLHIFQRLIHQHESEDSALVIESTPYSLSAMAEWLLDELSANKTTLQVLLRKHDNKSNRIICFLATLELIRLQYVYVNQSDHLAPIHLSISRLPNLPPIQSMIGEF
ncbi:MAG: segregation/condensation protein A [Myxococcota bacterium]|nr:segregation/condensation protein A [Myxococcota bacterium]